LLLCDPIVEEIMGGALEGLRGATRVEFGGECSPEEIDRVTKAASDGGADAVVGIGAGRRWTRRSPSPTRRGSRSS
jgi:glycerol dehydrogenase